MIRLVVTDMDGTFLRSDMTYDRERFDTLFNRMKETGAYFVVASGNQYYQIRSFFQDKMDDIWFAAENGNFLVKGTEPVFNTSIEKEMTGKAIDAIQAMDGVALVVCGKESAYISGVKAETAAHINKFFHRLRDMDTLTGLQDEILKLTVITEDNDAVHYAPILQDIVGDSMVAVATAKNNVDIMKKGINKGTAIAYLQERLGISPSETMVFGDNGNDIEMLGRAEYSYAMDNAIPRVKEAARFTAPSNNDDGVLAIMEQHLK
ncbi:Cof-type HAD-IIB family hydrolase [Youngiibacter fragilis]|uniref:Sugar phosphatase SupH n=1 Tax=Youngiibacter fragilis 232.1 TaxID=994573 RepID=V7I135_9CLOT|nr:Cof-type HAD-IIB family hydrolase [Youngiibacter fragilis]ETA78996.1 sugar phosphatase SupH [Youngiibacter fragilis 232.1]